MKHRILLPIITYPEPNTEACFPAALALSKHLDADLHAVALEPAIAVSGTALSRMMVNVPAMVADIEKRCVELGTKMLETLKQSASGSSAQVVTRAVKANTAFLGEFTAHKARYYDLTMLSWQPSNDGIRSIAEALIFGSGRPTLLVPEKEQLERIEHVAIAWDGSVVAARAIAETRFIVERASSVTVITVTDEKQLAEQDAGDLLTQALREAGVNVNFTSAKGGNAPVAQTLQTSAREAGADLLIMGAYGHSRLRDFVLGGATKGILSNLTIPVLLAH